MNTTNLNITNYGWSTSGRPKLFDESLSGQASDGPFLFVLDNFETIRD